MWVEIICGLVFYRLVRRFFYDDDIMDVETSDATALFSVAHRLEKFYGGKAYVGLRIPDADTSSRQNIDIVLVTRGEVVVVSVKNISGLVWVSGDGSWVCEGASGHTTETYPDPVAQVKKQALILESYLQRRGIDLPEGNLSYKVVVPNPKFRTVQAFPTEVVTYEDWEQLKPMLRNMLSGWLKGAFSTGNSEMQESLHQQLTFILGTAPIWDRLELNGNKTVLGEFIKFKGKHEDTLALGKIKRSKVGRIEVQKTSMFGLAPTKLQVLYAARDYRKDGASASEWKEVTVSSSTEVLFQPSDSKKVRKFKLSSVVSIALSA